MLMGFDPLAMNASVCVIDNCSSTLFLIFNNAARISSLFDLEHWTADLHSLCALGGFV